MKLTPKPSPPHDGPTLERVDAYEKDLGGLIVRRALPGRGRRLVGPWCFLDHFGPAPMTSMNVGPHPHIGLQTVTWLIEGEIRHVDSLGTEQVIRAGQLNWMTAGAGIVHAELGDHPVDMHGVQFWVALPDAKRHIPPAFEHIAAPPVLDRDGATISILAGTHDGVTCPATIHHPMVGLDLQLPNACSTTLPLDPTFEHGVVVVDGGLDVEGEAITPGTLLYLGTGRDHVTLRGQGRAVLVGGLPLGEDVLLWWNFVARTHEDIVDAAARWREGGFPELQDAGTKLTMPALP